MIKTIAVGISLIGLLELTAAVRLNSLSSGRRNLIAPLIALELILLALGLLLVATSFELDDLLGALLALLILPLAGAESAVALALLVAFYPSRLNILLGERSAGSRRGSALPRFCGARAVQRGLITDTLDRISAALVVAATPPIPSD